MRILNVCLTTVATIVVAGAIMFAQGLTPKEQLGKQIFFDTNLSTPTGQSCAACHGPEVGFTGPVSTINQTTVVYPGAVATLFGNRKPPSAAYGGESPVLFHEKAGKDELFEGGMFWDGRATGWELGDPLAEQARGPFLNPVEQNNANKDTVIQRIRRSSYASLFEQVYGSTVWNDVNDAYNKAAFAISAYEKSSEVNPFTSKYDYSLKGMVKLSKEEQKGLALFKGKGKCSKCHLVNGQRHGEPPLFTDFTYDNLGVPKNPSNPFYSMPPGINPQGANWIDQGLGGFLETVAEYSEEAEDNIGKQKVPTLRNVDKRPYAGFVKAYTHNGYFKTLKDVVHFYNTRDVEAWPPPEVAENVNTSELGNLRLTSADEDALVAFLTTLSDGYVLPGPGKELAEETGKPATFTLMQNVPNPFNPTTTVGFQLPEASFVTLKVYDVLGREVRTLVNGELEQGTHEVNLVATNLASGIYMYRLVAEDPAKGGESVILTRKMVLMK